MKYIKTSRGSAQAQGVIEYSIIIALIAIIAVGVYTVLINTFRNPAAEKPRTQVQNIDIQPAQSYMTDEQLRMGDITIAQLKLGTGQDVGETFARARVFANIAGCDSPGKILVKITTYLRWGNPGHKVGDPLNVKEFEETQCITPGGIVDGDDVVAKVTIRVNQWLASAGLADEVYDAWIRPFLRDLPQLAADLRNVIIEMPK